MVQDAAQGFHWNCAQATIHPWVYYYKQDNELKHGSFTVISECNTHDVIFVHLYIKELISHLKKEFGNDNVNVMFYFSDGCAGQYKNCKAFLNLCYHKEDFGVGAEWHFFATSHGKGPSDGVGGTVKRQAVIESLRRPYDNQIMSPIDLFNFAVSKLILMKFCFVTHEQYQAEEKLLSNRLKDAKTIAGTQKLHAFIPTSKSTLNVSEFSYSLNVHKEKVIHGPLCSTFTGQLSGYVTVRYNTQWWLAYIYEAYQSTHEVKVKFLHPPGPSSNFYFPEIDDYCILDVSDLLVSVNPTTITGRTYNLSVKDIENSNKKK